MLNNLSNKVAIVTGASRGIGRAIATKLANIGLTVIGTATTLEGKNELTSHLATLGNYKSFGVLLNATDPNSIEAAITAIKEKVGSPLILINNAGITRDNLFLRMRDEDWDEVISTNLSGTFRLTKACIKPMVSAKWGRIVNISSIVAFSGNIGQANYTASKAGIIGFTKSLAQEVASRNITVNAIAPGFIDTALTQALPEKIKTSLLAKIPMGRLGSVTEVAKAVIFLVSEDSSYITGNTIHINGGMFMS